MELVTARNKSHSPRVITVWSSLKSQELFVVFLQFLVMRSPVRALVLPLYTNVLKRLIQPLGIIPEAPTATGICCTSTFRIAHIGDREI